MVEAGPAAAIRLAWSLPSLPPFCGRGLGARPEARPRPGLAEGVHQVRDDLLLPIAELRFAVPAQDVAVAAQPEVAVVVDGGLVRPLVLAAVELDHHAEIAPQAVDLPLPDADVALGQRDRG